MEQISFFDHVGTRPTRTVSEFVNDTRLLPASALAVVVDELVRFFRGSDGHVALLSFLDSHMLEQKIEQRACMMFTTQESFRRECTKPNATTYFAGFVRKWLADELRVALPDLHRKLPATFRSAGLPIAAHQRAS